MGTCTLGIVTHAKHINLFAATKVLQEALKPHFGPSCSMSASISPACELMRFVFQVPDGNNAISMTRRLSVFFDCQTDNPEFGDDHISLSLGCWGTSVELMKAATLALAKLAGPSSKAYLLADDSTDEDFVDLMPNAMSQDPEVKRLTALAEKARQLQIGEEISEFSTDMWLAERHSGETRLQYLDWAVNRVEVALHLAELHAGEKVQG